jgi:hypothetical protein
MATLSIVDNHDGTFTATCSGATDIAGNSATPVSATYSVIAPIVNLATTGKNSNPNNSIMATVGSAGASVGDTVNVAVAVGTFSGAVGCTDSEGNIYTVVLDNNTGNGRLFVCSSLLTHALGAGDTVTAKYPGFSGVSAITVNSISSLVSLGSVDASAITSGNSSGPNSGPVSTSKAADVLFGVIANNSTPTFTAGGGYTAVGQVAAGSGSGKVTISPEYDLVSQTGSYSATGTLSAGQFWRAGIIAYKGT